MQLCHLPDAALRALDLPPTDIRFPGVSAVETPQGKVWVKTVEPPTRQFRRIALAALGDALPLPILRPSKAGKGGDTLLLQADQIRTLRAAHLPVPDILYGDRDFLILSDAGLTIDAAVKYDDVRKRLGLTTSDLQSALLTMTDTLAAIHRKGFAHGRPKIRDCGWQDGAVTILDLEERPWEVMPMAAAQARDVFLWIVDLCSYPLSRPIAAPAFARMAESMGEETASETRRLLRLLSIAAPPARLAAKIAPRNREIAGSLGAYDVMKEAMHGSFDQAQPAK